MGILLGRPCKEEEVIRVDGRVNARNDAVSKEERRISHINVDERVRVNAWNDAVFYEERRISLYSNKQHILLVGEGDFSFAKALATAFVSAPALVATSLDSLEMLQRTYTMFNFTLQSLIRAGVVVMHGVDATRMAEDERLRSLSFDRIVYNFPHAGFRFSEASSSQIEANKQLLRGFFYNAARLLKEQGEVHVTHHVGRHPYTEWNLQGEAAKSGLALKLCVQFHPSTYPGYVNRKGAGFNCAETFPLQLSGTHIFCKSYP